MRTCRSDLLKGPVLRALLDASGYIDRCRPQLFHPEWAPVKGSHRVPSWVPPSEDHPSDMPYQGSTYMTSSLTASISRNQSLTCSLHHCSFLRTGLNLWCKAHTVKAMRYGSPNGKPLNPKLWASERAAVSDLFQRNATHAGQLQAVEVIDGLMTRASANEGAFKGGEELARLARHGVRALDILTEVCAISLYLNANPRAVPDDRSWDVAVSAAVFKLAPRPRRMTRKPGTPWPVSSKAVAASSYAPKPRTSALLYVGRHLRQSLAPLIANVQRAIETREAQHAAFRAAMSVPLATL